MSLREVPKFQPAWRVALKTAWHLPLLFAMTTANAVLYVRQGSWDGSSGFILASLAIVMCWMGEVRNVYASHLADLYKQQAEYLRETLYGRTGA